MSLEAWSEAGLVTTHQPSRQEISDLLAVVDTDLRDASILELSPERKLSCSYGAILSAARAALHASGYRVSRSNRSHHYQVIQSLRYTAGFDSVTVLRIEAVQKKRNTGDYVRVGAVSDELADEARGLANEICSIIRRWLGETHPDLHSP